MASINTNVGAMVALRNLSSSNEALAKTQDRVSTGLKVIGAKDDASSFAIAQGIRGDLKAYQAVQQGLANGKGIGDVALAGLTAISGLLTDMKKKAIEGMNAGNTAQQQTILDADYTAMKDRFANYIANSSYSGKNLLSSGSTDALVISTISGGTMTISNQAAVGGLSFGDLANITNAAGALSLIEAAITTVGTALGDLGSDINSLKAQSDFLKSLSDSTTEGLGSIVDADLAEESANLQALQVKQQLGVQALSIANGAPQILLSLFR
jgi:flagellin